MQVGKFFRCQFSALLAHIAVVGGNRLSPIAHWPAPPRFDYSLMPPSGLLFDIRNAPARRSRQFRIGIPRLKLVEAADQVLGTEMRIAL